MKTIISTSIVVVALSLFSSPGHAQHGPSADVLGAPRAESPILSAKPARKMALGLTVDALPIILSATRGEVGMSGQAWMAVEHVRFRLVGAKLSQPNWLAAKDGFRDQDTTVAAVICDYVFGDHFDEFWVGTGFELWSNSIGHGAAPGERASWTNVVWTAGGGYIWRVIGNFYLEPWVAVHVTANEPKISLAGQTHHPVPVAAEASLKMGWFLEL